ncbi:MAG: TetR/AcrR family transcriptional regulator C-terminal domain-containing protein [Kibdelosporangium sp.]
MPRPRSLTHDDIARAALAVIDRAGLEALAMRAVASELGMGTMSLYRYVIDRAQLEALVVDLVLGEVNIVPPRRAAWTKQATVLVERVRDAVGRHPAVIPLTVTHRHSSVNSLRWTESMLEVLTAAGFTGKNRVVALRSLLGYLIGAIQLDHHGPLSGAATVVLAEQPDFPLLAETATHARRLGSGEEFGRGLAALLQGLEEGRNR